MADLAAQREARRRKIAMNAKARMNKLLGNETEPDSSAVSGNLMDNKGMAEEENLSSNDNGSRDDHQSPYNLRNRGRNSSPSTTNTTTPAGTDTSPSSSKTANVPYKVVEDPEVPDLAEFLASQEAAKAAEVKSRGNKERWTVNQYAEALRIGGCILTAALSRCSLKFDFSLLFQSVFVPFIVFEIFAGYIINVHLKNVSSLQSSGSLLSSALVLCGIKPELINVYNKIMNHVMFITNDFFTFLFAFIFIHVCMG